MRESNTEMFDGMHNFPKTYSTLAADRIRELTDHLGNLVHRCKAEDAGTAWAILKESDQLIREIDQ